MFDEKTVLAVIPARGGSKGVPRKNIREVDGKPLLAWTVEEAKKSRYIDRMILSSEDEEIIEIAENYSLEVPFVRPAELAKDETLATDVIMHAIEQVPGYDYIVLLQVTSPLRTAEDIDRCIKMCAARKAKAIISVTEPDKSPYWVYSLDNNGFMRPVIQSDFLTKRRQDHPKVYVPNGAIYIAETSCFIENKNFAPDMTIAYKMPKERSLDIDTEIDFKILGALLQGKI